MIALDTLILTHAAATWFMTGVIWFVQVIHYPLMARVGESEWTEYERAHQRRTSFVVMPAMLLEAGTAALILFSLYANAADRADELLVSAWIGAGLLAGIWLSTFFVQVPLHDRLSRSLEAKAQRKLVGTNWIRTVLWSGRAAIAGVWLA